MPQKKKGETSYKETAFGIIPRSQLIPLEIEGIKRAWDFVLDKNDQDSLTLTATFLKKVHKIGFAWIFPKIGGQFRTIEVTVSQHAPPRPYQVPQLMDNFTKDLKTRLIHLPKIDNSDFINQLIDLLAWAHHRFLWIHPFADYNGRIARLLVNIILLKLNLPPIELKVQSPTGRSKYIESLQQADHGDNSKLKKLFLAAIEEATKELE